MTDTDERLEIIADDAHLQRRLEHLLHGAIRRQLWITFLDEDDRETGVLLPSDDYPTAPEDLTETDDLGVVPAAVLLADRFAHLMDEFGWAQLVAVWERRGPDAVREPERRWAAAFEAALRERGVRVRAQFLLHDRGMRRLAPDDLVVRM